MSPMGAVSSEGSSGENISHFGAIRIRLYGNGFLKMAVHSIDDIRLKVMVPFVMIKATRIIPTRIVNFQGQRASFELKTTAIDEKFRIHRIVVFTKEIYTSYPG